MRWIVLLAVLPLLGACNMVISEKPLFTAADAAGAPPLRDGLWLSDDAKCRVDIRKPAQTWPKCADWYLVRGGEMLNLSTGEKGEPPGWQALPFVLATGDPRIMQLDISNIHMPDTAPLPFFFYTAISPTAQDDQGRVTAYRFWTIQCGPPPLDAKGKPDPLGMTERPFPGLTVTKATGSQLPTCMAGDAAAVRGAAIGSEALDLVATARWVRDGLP